MRSCNPYFPTVILAAAVLTQAGGLPLLAAQMDQRIETSARSSYNFKVYLKDDAIKVESSAGVVTLTGTVSEDYHKSLAEETVSGLPGVKSVINLLKVAENQPTEHSDAWITMKVKTALAFHQHVSATQTQVTTQGGVVTLAGTTDSAAMKELTGEYAMDVEGVTQVRNDLKVANTQAAPERLGAKVDDASITAQIKTSLLFRKSTHTLSTRVATREGVVTLHGEARNPAERDLVTRIAKDIKGVKEVHNRMTLQKS